MIRKNIAAVLAVSLLSAVMPLAASALQVGVSDSVSTSIASGHLCRSSEDYSIKSGVEWSSMSGSKVGKDIDASTANSYVVDPADSHTTNNGTFDINVKTQAGSAGTYLSTSHSSEQLTGGAQADTTITHTVSAFSNP